MHKTHGVVSICYLLPFDSILLHSTKSWSLTFSGTLLGTDITSGTVSSTLILYWYPFSLLIPMNTSFASSMTCLVEMTSFRFFISRLYLGFSVCSSLWSFTDVKITMTIKTSWFVTQLLKVASKVRHKELYSSTSYIVVVDLIKSELSTVGKLLSAMSYQLDTWGMTWALVSTLPLSLMGFCPSSGTSIATVCLILHISGSFLAENSWFLSLLFWLFCFNTFNIKVLIDLFCCKVTKIFTRTVIASSNFT